MRNRLAPLCVAFAALTLPQLALAADTPFAFSTGGPDNRIATFSGKNGDGPETETADDFVLGGRTILSGGTFTGLLPEGFASRIRNVSVEIYHLFPLDSTAPPAGRVPTRDNSPADVAFRSRSVDAVNLSYTTTVLDLDGSALNSVVSGINPSPLQFTGGEGPVRGQVVEFSFNFTTALSLAAGHYFFKPGVELTDGSFLWLSAPKPIVAPGTPFTPDLQSWIRNEGLAPDWLRIGTDITGQGPFNAAFSLEGTAVPEAPGWLLMSAGFAALGLGLRRRASGRTA